MITDDTPPRLADNIDQFFADKDDIENWQQRQDFRKELPSSSQFVEINARFELDTKKDPAMVCCRNGCGREHWKGYLVTFDTGTAIIGNDCGKHYGGVDAALSDYKKRRDQAAAKQKLQNMLQHCPWLQEMPDQAANLTILKELKPAWEQFKKGFMAIRMGGDTAFSRMMSQYETGSKDGMGLWITFRQDSFDGHGNKESRRVIGSSTAHGYLNRGLFSSNHHFGLAAEEINEAATNLLQCQRTDDAHAARKTLQEKITDFVNRLEQLESFRSFYSESNFQQLSKWLTSHSEGEYHINVSPRGYTIMNSAHREPFFEQHWPRRDMSEIRALIGELNKI